MAGSLAPHNAVAAIGTAHAADLFFHFLGAPRGCTLRKVVASLAWAVQNVAGLNEPPVLNLQGGTRIFQSFVLRIVKDTSPSCYGNFWVCDDVGVLHRTHEPTLKRKAYLAMFALLLYLVRPFAAHEVSQFLICNVHLPSQPKINVNKLGWIDSNWPFHTLMFVWNETLFLFQG